MDRPKRAAATKVSDFRCYHLSGDLDQQVLGIVDSRVNHFEMATVEELKKQIEEEKEQSRKLQEDVEMRNQLEIEKLKQQQWKTALDKLKQAKEEVAQEYDKCMEQMDSIVTKAKASTTNDSLQWFKAQVEALTKSSSPESTTPEEDDRLARERMEKEAAIADIKRQQEELNKRLTELQGGYTHHHTGIEVTEPSRDMSRGMQEDLISQLRNALSGKKETDQNKTMLKALVTQQNKVPGAGGTSTLSGTVLRGTTGAGSSMADWLANLNRQEEGESDLTRIPFLGEEDGTKGNRGKSGILDRATTNIQQKQIWSQQNLGEDWADEDVEFKQM